jgi:serine protease inhibitor
LFSPFSVHAALAMTAVGARGDSFSQLAAALHVPDHAALPAAGAFVRFYGQRDRPYELAVANPLWGQEGLAWEEAFTNSLAADFGAGFHTADFAGDGFQVVTLPYAGGDVECVVILPRAADQLPAVEKRFNPAALSSWLDAAEPVKVAIWLPRFRLEQRYDLVAALATLGVRDLFIPEKADLSGMTSERLAVGRVVHQAFVEVNEEGTEAAAATAVIANTLGPPPPRPVEFRADRPFLFLIRDRVHGTILFLGRSTGPA